MPRDHRAQKRSPVDTRPEAVEVLAKRLKGIDWRDGCLMEQGGAALRALRAALTAAEAQRDAMSAALKLAREFGIASVGFHAMQSYALAEWVDAGMSGEPPVYDSPFVRAQLAQRGILTEAEKQLQAKRCACRGADDYCVCQNVPDRVTLRCRAVTPEGDANAD